VFMGSGLAAAQRPGMTTELTGKVVPQGLRLALRVREI
jgi:hypothetical protein